VRDEREEDPFEVLGVPRASDETLVRRAYARLLRHTRPERDAVAFQRLRRAFERALAIVRARGEESGDDAIEHVPPSAPPREVAAGALRAAWQHVAAGRSEAAVAEVRRVLREAPAGAEVPLHSFLLHESVGVPTARALKQALKHAPDRMAALARILPVLRAPEVRWAARLLEPSARRLAGVADRQARGRLFRARVADLLARDRLQAAVDLLLDPVVGRSPGDDVWLEPLAHDLMAACVLERPDLADRVAAAHPLRASSDWQEADTYALMRDMKPTWPDLWREASPPRPLTLWLRLRPVLEAEDLAGLGESVREHAGRNPGPYLACLLHMAGRCKPLLEHLLGTLSEPSRSSDAPPEPNRLQRLAAQEAVSAALWSWDEAGREWRRRLVRRCALVAVSVFCLTLFVVPESALFLSMFLAILCWGLGYLKRGLAPDLRAWNEALFTAVIRDEIPPYAMRGAVAKLGAPESDAAFGRFASARLQGVFPVAWWISQLWRFRADVEDREP
jgi:hypothetical protein